MAVTVVEPLGVVLCITPFNFPVGTLTFKVAPALTMGNAVIIKAPSDAPYFHRLLMELGGNDPLIIFEGADLERAVEESMTRILNAGQICCLNKRFLVQNSIKSKYVEKLKEAVLSLNIGDPMNPEVQMGPCVSDKAAKHIAAQVSKTIEQGATLALGGDRKGAFYSPTILDNVTPEMDVAKDMEIFGPVFPVIGFGNEQEAVKVANRTCYGLNGGVISEDLAHGIAVAKKIQAGTVVAYGDARQHHSAVIR